MIWGFDWLRAGEVDTRDLLQGKISWTLGKPAPRSSHMTALHTYN